MDYSDIINYEYTMKHKRMPMEKRAAQFSPFAALTGYEDSIDEAGRITDMKNDLSDDKAMHISNILLYLKDNPGKHISITYYEADKKKQGGSYINIKGIYKRNEEGFILLEDKTRIPVDDIIDIEVNDGNNS